MNLNRTIASLVTLPITQNVALIRISGEKTYRIIKSIFLGNTQRGRDLDKKVIFGKIVDESGKEIDEVLLLCFKKPNSYTGEDVVEISCHGNLFIVNKILQLILQNGADLAKEGEFTKQAFFNGKINLIQANAVNEIINAPSEVGAEIALHNLNSKNQKIFDLMENSLIEIIANIKVNIDYPEYDGVEYLTGNKVLDELIKIKDKLKLIREDSDSMKVYKEGLKVAIVGKPNVGKSTLLNSLSREDRAIVSPIAGTTRDMVETRYTLKGIPMVLIDTAGIRETNDYVEKIGVERSYSAIEKSDIVFFLTDNSQIWDDEDEKILKIVEKKEYILITNKSDKENKCIIPDAIDKKKIVKTSAKNNEIGSLEKIITTLFSRELGKKSPDYPYLSQSWQKSKLNQIIENLEKIIKSLEEKVYIDALCGDLEIIYKKIKELNGKEFNEDLLDIIFSKFCLGK